MSAFGRKLFNAFCVFMYCCSKFFGVSAYVYNFKRKNATTTKSATLISAGIFLYFITSFCVIYMKVLDVLGISQQKFVYAFAYGAVLLFYIISVTNLIFTSIQNRTLCVKFINQTTKLVSLFGCDSLYDFLEGKYTRMLLVNTAVHLFQYSLSVMLVTTAYGFFNCYKPEPLVMLVDIMFIYCGKMCVVSNFYLGGKVLETAFRRINENMKSVLRKVDASPVSEAQLEIHALAQIHTIAFDTFRDFIGYHSSQLLTITFSEVFCVSVHIFSSYYAFSRFVSDDGPLDESVFKLAVASTLYISMNCYTVYIIASTSHMVVKESEKLRDILRVCLLGPKSDRLGRTVEVFSLQLIYQKIDVDLCGMCKINYANIFEMILGICNVVFLLVQFDVQG